MEVPLLRAILKRGGSVSGKAERLSVAEELADLFGLTPEQRAATVATRSETVWYNHMCWTRQHLVNKGDLDKGERGVWAVTEQGRRRAQGAS